MRQAIDVFRYCENNWPPHGGEIVATGAMVWDAAIVLCKYLEFTVITKKNTFMKGCHVIELGAGVGKNMICLFTKFLST